MAKKKNESESIDRAALLFLRFLFLLPCSSSSSKYISPSQGPRAKGQGSRAKGQGPRVKGQGAKGPRGGAHFLSLFLNIILFNGYLYI